MDSSFAKGVRMKKYLWSLILLVWMCTACAPQSAPTQQSFIPSEGSYPNPSYPNNSYPNPRPSPADIPVTLTPAQQAAVSDLAATLNLPADQITLTSTEAVDWPDGCLGIQKIGVMCTQAIVPGYKIILTADGKQYEYHTSKDGSQIAQAGEVDAAGAVEAMVIKQLASNLGLMESDISVVSTALIDFPDSCLGVAMNNMMCAQHVTPGQIIVLEANGIQYEYHVTSDGSQIQPATLALTWTREGGIAGFCDSLTVFLSGEVYGSQCKPQSKETTGTFAKLLSASERSQFDTWIKELGMVNLDASNPVGVSDRMVIKLSLFGNGKGTLKKPDEQKLFDWVQNLYQKLNS
jgi:hypothetical protein